MAFFALRREAALAWMGEMADYEQTRPRLADLHGRSIGELIGVRHAVYIRSDDGNDRGDRALEDKACPRLDRDRPGATAMC